MNDFGQQAFIGRLRAALGRRTGPLEIGRAGAVRPHPPVTGNRWTPNG